MIDFHSHILPKIDDGSSSVEESCRMLQESARQGVSHIIATPHFYAHKNALYDFLVRRQQAWQSLAVNMPPSMPKVTLGAEVYYFEGIGNAEDLHLLRMENTPILLLEMPFTTWNSRMIQTILELNSRPDMTILLAHINRYLDFQSEDVWNRLAYHGVLMQANAEFFLNWKTRRKAVRMVKAGQIHLLGSDCHNMEDRAPNLQKACAYIQKKAGTDTLERMEQMGQHILGGGIL